MLQLQAGKLFEWLAGQVEYGPGNPQIRNSRSSAGGSWRPCAIVDHNRLAQNFVDLLPEHATQDV
jgi:hypothetical protein